MKDALFAFLDEGVSPWHAAAAAAKRLEDAGFARLEETEEWKLEPGKGYYTTRSGSAVVAWRMPEGMVRSWRVTASHSDSPAWRIKSLDRKKEGCLTPEVEGYGGMDMASWLNRPLTLAGRVVVRTAEGVESRLICPDQDLLCIPGLAVHMDRGRNDGHHYNPQIDLQPLYGLEGDRPLSQLVAEEAGVPVEDVLGFDLNLIPRQKAVALGEGLFMAPRIDDLECACTTLMGFLEGKAPEGVCPVWAMLDNEEVGSSSAQGAQGTFLRDVMDRVMEAVGGGIQDRCRAIAGSLCLSADNGHANHPQFPEKSDPAFPVKLGGGVILKYNASQKYTTNGMTAALFEAVCRKVGVPCQMFANRADLPGGSTLGNLLTHSISMPMADVGLPQLAMHAAVETAALSDAKDMVTAVTAFYTAEIEVAGDGVYRLS